jgi:hypothetical protein
MSMQGILVPASSVQPQAFFSLTRRLTFTQKTFAFAGLGLTDNVPILQTGIISGLQIKLSGSLVVTLGGGTAASTERWPYDLVKALRFSANGQSNLVNCSGAKLKLRDIMARGVLTDRGVQPLGGAASTTVVGSGGASPGTAIQQGTLSQASEIWGVGSNVTAIPGAPTTYPFELVFYVPLAWDEVTLTGAVFAQTSSTDLNLAIDWAALTDLFTLTGAATVTMTNNVVVSGRAFSIPQGPDGSIMVPDLSAFHAFIQTRYTTLANGDNEIRLVGQGVGRQLMRTAWQVWNGAAPQTTLAITAGNFGQVGWRYGGNDTPEVVPDGRGLRYFNERLFDADIGSNFGFACWDFAKEFSFRDSVDEGSATELRLLVNIASGVTLTSPVLEYIQETIFAGSTGA